MTASRGKLQIIESGVRWLDANTLRVPFVSSHMDRTHQLYVGRRLIGETRSVGEREFIVQNQPSYYGEHLTVVAIEGSDVGQDFGEDLPPRPYNKLRAVFDNDSWTGDPHEVDVRVFELFTSTEPEGAVDYATVVDAVVAEDEESYTLESTPLGPSGEWTAGVRGRDTMLPNGNVGTALEVSEDIVCYPPDFETPFTAVAASGTLTITAIIPRDAA